MPENNQLTELLKALLAEYYSDMQSAAVFATNGEIVGSVFLDTTGSTAQHCGELLVLAADIVRLTDRGNLYHMIVEGQQGFVVTYPMGMRHLLVVLARKQAKLGLVFLEMERWIRLNFWQIEGIIPPPSPGDLFAGATPDEDE